MRNNVACSCLLTLALACEVKTEVVDAGSTTDAAPRVDAGFADTGGFADAQPPADALPADTGAMSTTINAVLSGRQMVPPVRTPASGTGRVVLSPDLRSIAVTVSFADLADTLAAHIHFGNPGENGPIMFTLSNGPYTSPLMVNLTQAEFEMSNQVATFADAVGAIIAGRAYFNLHTMPNQSGELRGQIGPVEVRATLNGGQEVPPVSSMARGTGRITVAPDQASIDVHVETENLVAGTAAHIHLGGPGENGPVLFVLEAMSVASPLSKTLRAADLMPQMNVADFAAAVDAIIAGRTYINVHTMARPGGELRGQIGPVWLRSDLSGLQQAPPTQSAGAGFATVQITPDQTKMRVHLEFTGVADANLAHIHFGELGTNGPVIFDIATEAFNSPRDVELTAARLMPQMAAGITSFSDALAAVINGQTYFNVHSATNPPGELRGQIGPVTVVASLSGMQEVPAVATAAKGRASITVRGDQQSIRVRVETTDLMNAVAAHIHLGEPGQNGPVLFPLATMAFTSPLDVTLRANDLNGMSGVGSFKDAVTAILAGRAYLNIHTTAFPGGELRGQIGQVRLENVLSGRQENPPVDSTATGTARVWISADQSRFLVTVTHTGLGTTTGLHIHAAQAGENGPILFPLANTQFGSPFNISMREADLMPRASAGISTFGDAIGAMIGGRTYINAHTMAVPSGELRGQIGAVQLATNLRGDQEVPAVSTAGLGRGWVVLSPDQKRIRVDLNFANLAMPTAAHIHLAPAGANGPVLFPIRTSTFSSPLRATLSAAELLPMGSSFDQAITALLTGGTYVNIHTAAVPSGELRGQVGPVQVAAVLSGRQEVPAVTTAASGAVRLTLSADQARLAVRLEGSGLGTTTAAHIHAAPTGRNGPVVFALSGMSFMTPLDVSLAAGDLAMNAVVADFGAAISALLGGKLYVNVHTMANPSGELRGQIGPVRLRAALGGGQEVPPATTAASADASVSFSPDQSRLHFDLRQTGLTAITAAHLHVARPGMNGPVVLSLASSDFGARLEVTRQSGDEMSQMGAGILSFNDVVSAVLAGETYINVHTMAVPSGELRGQVGPVRLTASLNGAQELPPVTTIASGSGTIFIHGDHSKIDVELSHTNLAEITAAHVHAAPRGMSGPVIFGLAMASFASPLSVEVTAANLMAQMGAGILDFGDAIDAMIGGRTYFNIHTLSNAGGEVRGQITP